jgi:hypothetical protein
MVLFPSELGHVNFFRGHRSFKKDNNFSFEKFWGVFFFVVKNHLPIQFVKNIWLKCLVEQLCPCVVLPSPKKLIKKCYQTWLKR